MKQKFEYSLVELRAIISIRDIINQNIPATNNDFFMVETEDLPFQVSAFSKKFFFKIDVAPPDALKNLKNKLSPNGEPIFHIEWKPQSEEGLNAGVKYVSEISDLFTCFSNWKKIVFEYSNTHLNAADKFIAIYTEEFLNELNSPDPDADIKPYDTDTQLTIYHLLDNVNSILFSNNEKFHTELLMQEVVELQGDLQDLTKNQTVSRVSKIMAKIKKAGIGLLKEVWTETRKMAYKMILQGPFDEAHIYLQHHHLLP